MDLPGTSTVVEESHNIDEIIKKIHSKISQGIPLRDKTTPEGRKIRNVVRELKKELKWSGREPSEIESYLLITWNNERDSELLKRYIEYKNMDRERLKYHPWINQGIEATRCQLNKWAKVHQKRIKYYRDYGFSDTDDEDLISEAEYYMRQNGREYQRRLKVLSRG
jgi:hypothetical protein